jgi:hypothetical protein
MHVNKVHHVTTINRVAKDLGETEDWLSDVANEMDIEDGVIWVYGVGEDGVMAFTDLGNREPRRSHQNAQRTHTAQLGSLRPMPDGYADRAGRTIKVATTIWTWRQNIARSRSLEDRC